MSSVGQALGGLVGGVVGFFVGGPVGALRGAQLGIMAGGLIDPPDGPVINGPRLDDLSVQTSTYGAFIPRNYGTIAQTGNVFWIQGDSLTEVQTTTESGGKGGPTQTTNTWSYYATFAVGLCQGPIDGVRRIWIGGQLWYDAGSADIDTIIASNQQSDKFTLYLGTDTQTADPLMQADKGVANVPAYRGLAYIVFDTLPLENYGNSLAGAQVKVEIVKNGTITNELVDTVAVDHRSEWHASLSSPGNQYDRDGARNFVVQNVSYPAPAFWVRVIGESVSVTNIADYSDLVAISSSLNDLQYSWGEDNYRYVFYGSDGNLFSYDCGSGWRAYTIAEGDGNVFITRQPFASAGYYLLQLPISAAGVNSGRGIAVDRYSEVYLNTQVALSCVAVWDGKAVVFSRVAGSTANLLVVDIYSGTDTIPLALVDSFSVAITPADAEGIDVEAACGHIKDDKLYIVYATTNTTAKIAVVDMVAQSLLSIYSVTANLPNLVTPNRAACHAVGNLIFWGYRQTSTEQLYGQTWLVGQMAEGGALLSDIVEAECLTSNLLTAGDLDVTALTDTVRGYRVTQLGAIRGAIDPLRAAFPFDVVQHGYDIKFVRRGTASVATIPSDDLDARQAGEAPGVQITDTREMDIMLPRRVSLNYVDVTREYETNQQYAERINTDAINERLVELPIVFNADEAAKKAETLLYMYWMERYDVAFRLPHTYADLEPGDVITITSTDATYELRLTSVNTLPDGRLECQAKYNQAALYTPTAEGEEGQSTGNLLTLHGPSVYSLLDIPLMLDDNDTAGFPVAMSGYLTGWPGGILYRSDDDGGSWTDLKAFPPGCVIGYATNSLAAHGGTVYDFSSALKVWLYTGTLASVTEAQLFSGSNWFAYGADGRWEIVAARTATLQADGSYILTDLLRGQHGTEWATGLHEVNDRIVLLDQSSLAFVSVNASSIGTSSLYRGITVGKSLDSDADLTFSYDGVNLECLSPINLKGDINPGSNQWTLHWTRRSRYVEWRDYVDAPLGEASASYEVDIYSSSSYTTVKRTLTSTSETVNYSSANQVTDFGSNQTTLYVKVYQLSATVGRGYPLTASITR